MATLLTSLLTPSGPESCAPVPSGSAEELLPGEPLTGFLPELSGVVMKSVKNEAIGLGWGGQEGEATGIVVCTIRRRATPE